VRGGTNTEEREGRDCEGKKETESGGELHRKGQRPRDSSLEQGEYRCSSACKFSLSVGSHCVFTRNRRFFGANDAHHFQGACKHFRSPRSSSGRVRVRVRRKQ